MKVAYIITPSVIVSGSSNGIKAQANSFCNILENNHYSVTKINNWENYDFKKFDVIHLFGNGSWILPIVKRLSLINNNIYLSPIIDTNTPNLIYYLYSLLGFTRLKLMTPAYSLRLTSKYVKGFIVRSNYESLKVNQFAPKYKIHNVGLSINKVGEINSYKKEKFCLHVSSIYQKRKNVIRLIRAAKKYQFKLILAGSKGNKQQFQIIEKEISNNKNIIVKGFVSNSELQNLYSKAKVFALPSLREGVGIVALDAAINGCNVVITERGGGKEFYNNYSKIINPFSVDDIGKSVIKSMEEDFDISLIDHLERNYSPEIIFEKLNKIYHN